MIKVTIYGRLRKYIGQSTFEINADSPKKAFSFLINNIFLNLYWIFDEVILISQVHPNFDITNKRVRPILFTIPWDSLYQKWKKVTTFYIAM